MRNTTLLLLAIYTSCATPAQMPQAIFNKNEVERIEKVLSSDEMKGRKILTPEIEKAARFIASEFKTAGLQTWKETGSYLQPFVMTQPGLLSVSGKFDKTALKRS